MRIISGTHRGRTLICPEGTTTRPTSDRVKESIFNLLTHSMNISFSGLHVLDMFAGSGALGIEALSRGAKHATFVEKDRNALQAIHQNTQPFPSKWILPEDATTFILPTPQQFDLVFLDPPYNQGLLKPCLTHLVVKNYVGPKAVFVIEMSHKDTPDLPSFCVIQREKIYRYTKVLLCTFNQTLA